MTASICPRCGAALIPGASPAGLCPACLLSAALSDELDFDMDEWPSDTFPPGTTLGPFRIVRVLGVGGMGTVYEAEDPRLEREIALKVLPTEFLHDATFSKRFAQEGRVIASLEHPNIVPIYASGIDEGIPWMSMRLLVGGNLGALLENRRPEPGEIVRILREVAGALDYAHARGVVHRDIKPTNLLLDGSGHVSVADFGLAYMLEGRAGLTRSGMLAGTPHYMAPEQALGKTTDHRCDIYSLGIVAYEMFVGSTPFTADSPVALLLKHVNEVLPEPPGGEVPPQVMHVIQQAAAKDPGDRWPSATAFVDALERVVASVPACVNAVPVSAVASVGGRKRSRVAWITASLAGAVSVAAVMGWVLAREPSAPLPSTPSVASEPFRVPEHTTSAPVSPQETSVSAAPTLPPPVSVPTRPVKPDPGTILEALPARTESTLSSALPSIDVSSLPVQPSPRAATDDTAPVAIGSPSPSTPGPSPLVAGPRQTADVVMAPVRTRTVSPDYPNVARAAQIEGDVLLEASVTSEGRVVDVSVVRSVHPLLDEAARKAVLQYGYTPGQRNGVPESARIRITVSFRMR